MTDQSHRDTIFLEEGEILSHEAHPGDQYVLRLWAPECARAVDCALGESCLDAVCRPTT